MALWNRPKLVLQTLGKLAIRFQELDRKLNVPRTFGHFRADQAHAQEKPQSAKSFLALWNRPKLVLQTLGKLAIGLLALDRKLNLPELSSTSGQTRRMRTGTPRGLKVFCTLESAQTSSADSGEAGDSLASVTLQTKCAPNFRAL